MKPKDFSGWIREEDVEEKIPDVPGGPLYQQWARERDEAIERELHVHRELFKTLVAPDGRTGPIAIAVREVIQTRMNGHEVSVAAIEGFVAAALHERGETVNRHAIKTVIARENGNSLRRVRKGIYRRIR